MPISKMPAGIATTNPATHERRQAKPAQGFLQTLPGVIDILNELIDALGTKKLRIQWLTFSRLFRQEKSGIQKASVPLLQDRSDCILDDAETLLELLRQLMIYQSRCIKIYWMYRTQQSSYCQKQFRAWDHAPPLHTLL